MKTLDEALGAVRKKMIIEALAAFNGNKAQAAKKLDISRTLVNFWCKRYVAEGAEIPGIDGRHARKLANANKAD